VKDIQSFLGFANFYRQFIFNYLDIVVPLTWLTRKDTPWNFSEDCRHSFNALKHTFTTVPILTHFIPDTPIIVETDASDYAVAGILLLVLVISTSSYDSITYYDGLPYLLPSCFSFIAAL